jgi:hypothetical protein
VGKATARRQSRTCSFVLAVATVGQCHNKAGSMRGYNSMQRQSTASEERNARAMGDGAGLIFFVVDYEQSSFGSLSLEQRGTDSID